MSWTKKQLIVAAFDEIGLGSYEFDMQQGQYASALNKLDSMMAGWNGKGIRLGYPLSDTQEGSSVDDDSLIPDWSYEATYQNLALRLAPSFGKVVMPELKQSAKDGYDIIVTKTNTMPTIQLTGLPSGQGAKSWQSDSSTTLKSPTTILTDGAGDAIDH
jgi:hypothetical protein